MHKRFRIFTVVAAVGVAVCALVIGAYAYVFGLGGSGAASAGTLPTFAPQTSAAPTTTTTTTAHHHDDDPGAAQPKAVKMPDPGRSMGIGADGPVVLAYEQRLASLHIDTGPVDGVYDQKTAYAIDTVEKIYGIQRDGQIGPQVRLALSAFQWPKPMTTHAEPDRVEVSLDKQYLVLYEQGWVKLITTVSTGGGYAFCGGDDGCQYAVTPPGPLRVPVVFQRLAHEQARPPLQAVLLQRRHRDPRVPRGPELPGVARVRAHPDAHRRLLPHVRAQRLPGLRRRHAVARARREAAAAAAHHHDDQPKVTPTTKAKAKPTTTTKPKTTTTTS